MTKKRRNLRILASIIAAGCVWATGMNDAWAAGIASDNINVANELHYVAIGNADTYSPFGSNATWADDQNRVWDVDKTATGIIVLTNSGESITYKKTAVPHQQVDASGRLLYNSGTVYRGSDGKYYEVVGDSEYIGTLIADTEEKWYWIRDGYGVKSMTERYHPQALDIRLDLYSKASLVEAQTKHIVTAGEHAAGITDVRTAINKVNLDKIEYVQYAAITNSNTTGTAVDNQFWIKRGETYFNAGSSPEKVNKNFYFFKDGDFDDPTGKYKFGDAIVEYDDVYNIGGNVGVFLTEEYSGTDASAVTTASLVSQGYDYYKGTVYGLHNEVLLSGYNATDKTWHTVWAAEITDPTQTIESMTIGDFNNILHHMHEEDVKLAMADIEYTEVASAPHINGGTISLKNKENVAVPGSLTITGGGGNSNDGDTFVTITGAGGWSYDAVKGEWVADSNATNGSFRINTGSVVVATSTTQNQNQNEPDYLNRIKINGTEYIIGNAGYQWNVGVQDNSTTASVGMDDDVIFTSTDGNIEFTLNNDNQSPGQKTIDIKLSDDISVKNIKLGDNNTTNITYNGNRIVYGDYDYQTNNYTSEYQVANLNDGMKYGADNTSGDTNLINLKLNDQLNIKGDNVNISTEADSSTGSIKVKLAKELTGLTSVTTETINTKTVNVTNQNNQQQVVQVNENGITVFGDTVEQNIVINKTQVNVGGNKIVNVADGEVGPNSTDAINGSQLYKVEQQMLAGDTQIHNRLDRLGNRVDKVGAGAAALAALHPLDFDPDDKLQFSAGVGNYRGETAAALGAFYRPTEKVMFSVAGTMGNDDNMVSAGVTFALDRKNNVSNSRVAMAHEIKDLREQVAALTALVSQIAGKGNPLLDTVMFPDVPENHWAYDYVENLQKRGIIEGYPDGNFAGDRSMTRYEYAAMLYRALEKGFPVDGRLLKEFEAELGRIRIDRIKGADDDANKVERVRVNDYEDRDDYGSKLAQVVADAAPVVEEEPAA